MAKAQVKAGVVLDTPVEGAPHLAVRNVSPNVQVVASLVGQPDLVLNLFQEQVIDGIAWQKSRTLRQALQEKRLHAKWVGFDYVSPVLPTVEEAPADAQPETFGDRAYALGIVISTSDEAVEMINEEAHLEGGRPNVKFLKERFDKVLRYVLWAEPQIQKRPKVVNAAKQRLSLIKAL